MCVHAAFPKKTLHFFFKTSLSGYIAKCSMPSRKSGHPCSSLLLPLTPASHDLRVTWRFLWDCQLSHPHGRNRGLSDPISDVPTGTWMKPPGSRQPQDLLCISTQPRERGEGEGKGSGQTKRDFNLQLWLLQQLKHPGWKSLNRHQICLGPWASQQLTQRAMGRREMLSTACI